MKKKFILLQSILLCMSLFITGCSNGSDTESTSSLEVKPGTTSEINPILEKHAEWLGEKGDVRV